MLSPRGYVYSLMTDKRHDPIAGILKIVLWLCSVAYGVIAKAVSTGYEKGVFIPFEADPKVISIGNITVGGTGKTQAVIAIARRLESQGRRPAVLIRGYGADECKMLQEELRDTPILVGPDRIKGSKRAFYNFGTDTVILDDGFQHWRIRRDLDIVLVDATNPFGNYQLIPRGILREPLTALKRADVIIITKVDCADAHVKEVYEVIERLGKRDCVLEAVYKPLDIHEISSVSGMGLGAIDKRRVCLVSGIANPSYFKKNVIGLGAQVELEFAFLDHYDYRKKDFYRIQRECKFIGTEFIIVTKKDAVKIKRLALTGELEIPILVLDVGFEIIKNKKVLDDRLSGIYRNQVS